MSTIVRYSNGSTYTIVPNKVDIEKVQDLDGQYHIPNTSIVGMLRLGLGVQRITVSGDSLDMSACLWHDVVAISFDSGTSYQTVYFAGVPYTSDCWSGIYPYALSLLASPLKEQAAVRYPTTGYKFGNQSITGISQAGNVSAYPTIHYLAPLFYAPLSNTLVDITGQSVTFTRTASKTHNGVVYPINTPIFDSGLYLASDTAQDVATWTPPVSTVRTIAMQIKMTHPITGTNLVTNGEFETDTAGWAAFDATLSRETGSPLAGAASLKVTLTATTGNTYWAFAGLTPGNVYRVSALTKTSVAAGRKGYAYVLNGSTWEAIATGTAKDASTYWQDLSVTFTAQTATDMVFFRTESGYNAGEYFLLDTVVCIDLTALFGGNTLTIWTSPNNTLSIPIDTKLIKWTDNTGFYASVALPASYWDGVVMDVVVLDDTSHSATIAVHPAGGSWVSNTETLAALTWPQLTLGNLEGPIANLVQYPYVLTSAEYQALAFSSLSLLYNALYIGNRYAGEIIKGSDKRLLNASGGDISALLGGVDIPIGASAVTIAQNQGMSARWYVEVKRTDV